MPATVSGVITPTYSIGAKSSKIHSAFNPANYIFTFADATVNDTFNIKLKFADDTETPVYSYSVVNPAVMRRDVSFIVNKFIKFVNPLAFTSFPAVENQSIIPYKVLYKFDYQEEYEETSWHFAASGVFQLGHKQDGNFFEYLTIYDNEAANVGNVGLFLSKFEKPKYFEGYPFYLCYISPLELNNNPINELAIYVNGEETPLADIDGVSPEKNYLIPENTQKGFNNAYISKGGSLGEKVFDDSFDDSFWGTPDEDAFLLIEEIEFEKVCIDHYISPLCIVWCNSLGKYEIWVFNKPTIRRRFTGEEYTEKPTDSLLETDFGFLINRNEEVNYNVSEINLTRNQYEALIEINQSPFVYIYFPPENEEELGRYEQIKVTPQTFDIDTKKVYYSVSFEFTQYKRYNNF